MKQKTIFTITFVIVMLNALTMATNITTSGEYRFDLKEITEISRPSQEQEYNISSYRDYAEASADILISRLMNLTRGKVFHAASYDWSVHEEYTSLANYYWTIDALARAYEMTNNQTYSIAMSKAVTSMVNNLMDSTYPGFFVNEYSELEIAESKRPGVQAYAYWALEIAESINASLDFTSEKASALTCLTDMLYDSENGGFYFFTMRNGSLNVPAHVSEVYPNDGKRLDHLVLGATVLYDAGLSLGNTTMLDMADEAMSFMISNMKYDYDMGFRGYKLAVSQTGADVNVDPGDRVAHSIVTDINSLVIKALIKGYEVTGNTTYLNSATQLFETLLANNWDDEDGGWFAEVVDGEPYDPLDDEDVKFYKYSEIQFQMILALEDLYEVTDSIYHIRLVIDILDLVLANLWDIAEEGFVRNGNQVWAVISNDWKTHYTAVQAQAVLCLERVASYGLPIVSRVRINPTNPRPQDNIHISVTALDEDGIDSVYVNYTLSLGGNDTNGIISLLSNPQVGGFYNNSLGPLEDGTSVNFEVVANDTTGQMFIAGSYHFLVRLDIYSPIAELHAIYPTGSVRTGDEVTIDIETYEFPEQSHTNSCEIRWRLFDSAFTSVNMTPIGVEDKRIIWRTVLGQFNGGDQIAFFCLVMDEAGNVGESRLYQLTILHPVYNITPITFFQIIAAVGLIAAPGVGYLYTTRRKSSYRKAQREGKKDQKRRARRRGSSRSRKQR